MARQAIARYPLIDITNAVLSRMLMGGPGRAGLVNFQTQGAIFYEVRSVGQKSNGMLEQLFLRPSMAVPERGRRRRLTAHPGTGWDALPFGRGVPCGGGAPVLNAVEARAGRPASGSAATVSAAVAR